MPVVLKLSALGTSPFGLLLDLGKTLLPILSPRVGDNVAVGPRLRQARGSVRVGPVRPAQQLQPPGASACCSSTQARGGCGSLAKPWGTETFFQIALSSSASRKNKRGTERRWIHQGASVTRGGGTAKGVGTVGLATAQGLPQTTAVLWRWPQLQAVFLL